MHTSAEVAQLSTNPLLHTMPKIILPKRDLKGLKIVQKLPNKLPKLNQTFESKAKDYVGGLFGLSSDGFDLSEVDEDFSPEELIDSENEFDLVKLVGKSVDPLTGVPRDIKIPEGDFDEAKNFFDFCSRFRGPDAKFPFVRQMWLMLMLFAEVCPRCTPKKRFNIHRFPVDADPQDIPNRMQLLKYGVCPRCKTGKADLIRSHGLREYTEMSLCIGQRAGKSTTISSGIEYMTHKYMMYPRMSAVCRGVSSATPLVGTLVGLRFTDAFKLLWEPIMAGIKDSPWFTSYHKMLDFYGQKHGIEFYRMKDVYLRYGHKNIELYPSGPTKRGLRGRTRIFSGVDEIGWFPVLEAEGDEREHADANGVYEALDRSLLTMRTEISYLYTRGHNRFLQAYAFNISSPSSQGDKITRLVEENKDSDSNLAMRLATWEVSPLLPRDNKIIVQAYRKDPIVAERDYGANAPLNAAVFIQQQEAEPAFRIGNRASISEHHKNINNKWRQTGKIETIAAPNPCPAHLMSIDAGLTNNSFAVTLLNLTPLRVGDVTSYQINVPVLLEVQPKKGHQLHYPMIYKHVLSPLIKDFNVRYFFADRWNSISLLDQAAEDYTHMELIAKQYSVKYNDFITARSYIEDGKLLLPTLEMPANEIRRVDEYPEYFKGKPSAHLLFQMITVRDMGKTVIKGPGYTDDLFRALVLGVSRILDEKIREQILMLSLRTRPKVTGAITVGRSGLPNPMGNPVHTFVVGSTKGGFADPNPNRSVHKGNAHVVRVGRY
jgi:hypothetical protein